MAAAETLTGDIMQVEEASVLDAFIKCSQERVCRKVDEGTCDHCGGPIRMGSVFIWAVIEGCQFCSRFCADSAAAELGKQVWILRDSA